MHVVSAYAILYSFYRLISCNLFYVTFLHACHTPVPPKQPEVSLKTISLSHCGFSINVEFYKYHLYHHLYTRINHLYKKNHISYAT